MKPNYSTSEIKDSMRTLKAAKQAGDVEIYSDNLLRVCVVVRHGDDWYIVPKSANGWSRRQRLDMTPEVRLERLRPARHIAPAWLGVQAENEPQDCPRTDVRAPG